MIGLSGGEDVVPWWLEFFYLDLSLSQHFEVEVSFGNCQPQLILLGSTWLPVEQACRQHLPWWVLFSDIPLACDDLQIWARDLIISFSHFSHLFFWGFFYLAKIEKVQKECMLTRTLLKIFLWLINLFSPICFLMFEYIKFLFLLLSSLSLFFILGITFNLYFFLLCPLYICFLKLSRDQQEIWVGRYTFDLKTCLKKPMK